MTSNVVLLMEGRQQTMTVLCALVVLLSLAAISVAENNTTSVDWTPITSSTVIKEPTNDVDDERDDYDNPKERQRQTITTGGPHRHNVHLPLSRKLKAGIMKDGPSVLGNKHVRSTASGDTVHKLQRRYLSSMMKNRRKNRKKRRRRRRKRRKKKKSLGRKADVEDEPGPGMPDYENLPVVTSVQMVPLHGLARQQKKTQHYEKEKEPTAGKAFKSKTMNSRHEQEQERREKLTIFHHKVPIYVIHNRHPSHDKLATSSNKKDEELANNIDDGNENADEAEKKDFILMAPKLASKPARKKIIISKTLVNDKEVTRNEQERKSKKYNENDRMNSNRLDDKEERENHKLHDHIQLVKVHKSKQNPKKKLSRKLEPIDKSSMETDVENGREIENDRQMKMQADKLDSSNRKSSKRKYSGNHQHENPDTQETAPKVTEIHAKSNRVENVKKTQFSHYQHETPYTKKQLPNSHTEIASKSSMEKNMKKTQSPNILDSDNGKSGMKSGHTISDHSSNELSNEETDPRQIVTESKQPEEVQKNEDESTPKINLKNEKSGKEKTYTQPSSGLDEEKTKVQQNPVKANEDSHNREFLQWLQDVIQKPGKNDSRSSMNLEEHRKMSKLPDPNHDHSEVTNAPNRHQTEVINDPNHQTEDLSGQSQHGAENIIIDPSHQTDDTNGPNQDQRGYTNGPSSGQAEIMNGPSHHKAKIKNKPSHDQAKHINAPSHQTGNTNGQRYDQAKVMNGLSHHQAENTNDPSHGQSEAINDPIHRTTEVISGPNNQNTEVTGDLSHQKDQSAMINHGHPQDVPVSNDSLIKEAVASDKAVPNQQQFISDNIYKEPNVQAAKESTISKKADMGHILPNVEAKMLQISEFTNTTKIEILPGSRESIYEVIMPLYSLDHFDDSHKSDIGENKEPMTGKNITKEVVAQISSTTTTTNKTMSDVHKLASTPQNDNAKLGLKPKSDGYGHHISRHRPFFFKLQTGSKGSSSLPEQAQNNRSQPPASVQHDQSLVSGLREKIAQLKESNRPMHRFLPFAWTRGLGSSSVSGRFSPSSSQNNSSTIWIFHSGMEQESGEDTPVEDEYSFISRKFGTHFLSHKSVVILVGLGATLLLFCCFLCVCSGTRWHRHRQYRKAFSKLEKSFSDLDSDHPFYLRLARLRRSPAGNQYVVTIVDESKFSVVDHDLESEEDEIFDVTDIVTADKKGPLARLQWTNQNVPF